MFATATWEPERIFQTAILSLCADLVSGAYTPTSSNIRNEHSPQQLSRKRASNNTREENNRQKHIVVTVIPNIRMCIFLLIMAMLLGKRLCFSSPAVPWHPRASLLGRLPCRDEFLTGLSIACASPDVAGWQLLGRRRTPKTTIQFLSLSS